MRRARLLVLVLTAVSACSETGGEECPGELVADLAFTGTRIPSGDPALAGVDPAPSVPDCVAAGEEFPVPEVLPPFRATLAADASTQGAALCRPGRAVLIGQRAGTLYTVETRSGGAVLPPSCSAALRMVVAGDLIPGTSTEPTSFQGVLVEVLSWVDGDCGAYLLEPVRACAARYALQGTP